MSTDIQKGAHVSVAELTRRRADGLEQSDGQRDAAQQALIDVCLSVAHRDNAADGCPTAAPASDMARGSADREACRAYSEGVGDFADWLATEDQDGMARLRTMVGALVLARATREFLISEEILTAAREALTATDWRERQEFSPRGHGAGGRGRVRLRAGPRG
ncbi:hypothetical protein [Streptomyces sp. NBC_01361]|uniref:hypothetical protein n=1 Tax=Streptomyces sp. NBC_01361 TaxID=2903838 RepID=UPI003FCE7BC9